MSNIYPAIPEPQPTLDALAETVRALKIAVELLTAQRGHAGAAHVFNQDEAPTAIAVGDFWITKDASLIRYWNGTQWLKLTTV